MSVWAGFSVQHAVGGGTGSFVSSPELLKEGKWVGQLTAQGFSLMTAANQLCGGEQAEACFPGNG